MRVLVTGAQGYIGAVLAPSLAGRGHDVVGVDAGFYELRPLFDSTGPRVQTLRRDIRQLERGDFEGVDAVVHMAELSNDPLSQLAPTITYEINHEGSVHVASLAKEAGVERFVYTSSCSVYGIAEADLVDEDSPLRPQTDYARCKELVERDVGAMADDSFSPVFLRNATVYGASPRMRFDLVLNNLCGVAWTTGVIRVESDGTPWRPLVHVRDVAAGVAAAVEAPRERVHNQILNVGAPRANYQVRELAETVAEAIPDATISIGQRSPDTRSYRVSFEKIRSVLPEFVPEWDVRLGAEELRDLFERISLTREQFESRDYTRLRQIEHLLRERLIDDSFFWTNGAG